MASTLLSLSPATDEDGCYRVISETPNGSRNKFDCDPEMGLFELNGGLPEGRSFPYDFGFVPGTPAEDGDPLDVLLLLDAPAFAGCLVGARLLDATEAAQTEDDRTERNDRLLAVAAASRQRQHLRELRAGRLARPASARGRALF